jgi:hypothetical protein
MNKRSFAIVAVGALFIASSATAEPSHSKPLPGQPAVQPATVVLALNTTLPAEPRKEDQNVPTPKKRTARVTSCRCGDPDPPAGALLELRAPQ